jgi:hypothetical protein
MRKHIKLNELTNPMPKVKLYEKIMTKESMKVFSHVLFND